MNKVYIAVPTNGLIKAMTTFSLFQTAVDAPCEVSLGLRLSCDVVGNRNWLVNDAIAKGCSHVLFVDSDMAFSSDTLKRLLAHEKDIVGTAPNHRRFPLETTVRFSKDQEPVLPKELFTCDAVGTGLLLIKTDVFYKLEKPYFAFEYDEEGVLKKGEDVRFCHKARDIGFEIWCDPTIEVGHIGDFIF